MYLMVLAHTIDKGIIEKYPAGYIQMVEAFQLKIVYLCKKIGIYKHCDSIMMIANWWKENNHKRLASDLVLGIRD